MFLKEKDFKGMQLRRGSSKMNNKVVNKNAIFWICVVSVNLIFKIHDSSLKLNQHLHLSQFFTYNFDFFLMPPI